MTLPKDKTEKNQEQMTVLLSSTRDSGVHIAQSLLTTNGNINLFLMDAAAVIARSDHPLEPTITAMHNQGACIKVDNNALKRRGISVDRLNPVIKEVATDDIADVLLDNTTKLMWL